MSSDAHDSPMLYVKIWAILLGLFAISVVGPMAEIRWLTLVTAFGIAIVKALMVAAYFMHLNIERRYVHYLMYTMLMALAVFYSGVAPDINKTSGTNWRNASAIELIEKHAESGGEEGHHDDEHH